MDAHQLPNDCQHKFLVTLLNVTCTYSDQLYFHLIACIKGNLTVNPLLESVVWIFFNSAPVHCCWVNLMDDLQENLTITDILE